MKKKFTANINDHDVQATYDDTTGVVDLNSQELNAATSQAVTRTEKQDKLRHKRLDDLCKKDDPSLSDVMNALIGDNNDE